jgi:hypothetical protein
VTLSEVADSPLYFFGWPEPVDGPEPSSTDVDRRWFRDHAYEEPLPSRPLSRTPLYLDMMVAPGSLTASVSVPTVTDDETEPTERVRLDLASWPQVIEDKHLAGAVAGQPWRSGHGRCPEGFQGTGGYGSPRLTREAATAPEVSDRFRRCTL